MKLLLLLPITFLSVIVTTRFTAGDYDHVFAGNAAMAVYMIFTGVAHFKYVKGMVMMIPDIFPAKTALVYITGLFEIAAGIGLLFYTVRELSAIGLIIFLILVFWANVNSSRKKVNLFKADYSGPGMAYLYRERIPMQVILIVWTWFFGIYAG